MTSFTIEAVRLAQLITGTTPDSLQDKKTSILSLGTRKDATTWQNGCQAANINVLNSIKKPAPTIANLKAFFKGTPHWLFFAGHFGQNSLANEDDSVNIIFSDDSIKLITGSVDVEIKKESPDFKLNTNCEVILWGGCSVCSSKNTIEIMRKLFGKHVLLGFAGLTGWKIVDAMLGGGFITNHFFKRLNGKISNSVAVRDAWMETARYGYGGGSIENRFRAIDPDGQEWKLSNKKIVKGRKFS